VTDAAKKLAGLRFKPDAQGGWRAKPGDWFEAHVYLDGDNKVSLYIDIGATRTTRPATAAEAKRDALPEAIRLAEELLARLRALESAP